MKSLTISLSFAILSLVAVGCKNDNVNPTSTSTSDNYVGVYTCQSTLSYGRTGAMATERPQSVTLTVSRVTNPDKPKALLFTEEYGSYSRNYSVYLDESSFTVDKTIEKVSVNGTQANGIMNGAGKFSSDGKSVSFNTSTDVDVAGPYNRSVKIEGNKK